MASREATMKRAAISAAMYRGGLTIQQIADHFGLSDVAIVFDLRRAGVDTRDVRAWKFYRCSHTDFVKFNDGQPAGARGSRAFLYMKQASNVKFRRIGWHISFPEWVTLWRDSGHFHERGRGTGYVMARRGDVGPYAIGNVYITHSTDNTRDGHKFRRARLAA